ncbi:MAG: SpoIVB peptidase S55 domain-containing protein [Bacilli bacterium]|nr:SpoIVB peptidase S55 domain-containing protein [Bacilli bacterium]
MKKFISFMLVLYLFIPVSVFAYSDYVMASGKNIGIELKSDYVLVVGSYDINNHNILYESELQIGDKIKEVNGISVNSAYELNEAINKINKDNITVTYLRDDTIKKANIKLYKDGNNYKSGLYVKDTIRGVATLTYIDVDNKTYGALGHEIIEKITKSKFDLSSGTIFKSTVTGITKSYDGTPGEKNARSESSEVYGDVVENTQSGLFGNYTDTIPNSKMYKVVTSDEIKLGNAKILTTIKDEEIASYDIDILRINNNSKTKNILFEVTDKNLLDIAGGIVQGMSGSPIIQGDNIVGAVNYVLVDKTNRGYGIFITNMLEEAEN